MKTRPTCKTYIIPLLHNHINKMTKMNTMVKTTTEKKTKTITEMKTRTLLERSRVNGYWSLG